MRFPMLLLLALGAAACRIDDFDEDGFGDRDDCDNLDAEIHPDADEICDGVDNNCDGEIDEGFDGSTFYVDADSDGFGDDDQTTIACSAEDGYAEEGGDCDDDDPFVFPDAPELCDDKDNDCDDDTDEDLTLVTWYADDDGDGFGVTTDFVISCAPQEDHSTVGGDCNDDDVNVHPGAAEACSGGDVDCDGDPAPLCLSCLDLRDNGLPSAGDGLYEIDIDGTGPGASQVVYCDMSTDGGGWTMVQRTVWAWSDTQALYTGYAAWYDDTTGDASPGAAFRLAGKHWQDLGASDEHLIMNALRTTTGGACGPLYYKATDGVLAVNSTTATITGAVQPVLMFNATELSTNDSGPDTCGASHNGVPWFYGNCCAMCPSYQGTYWSDEAHPMTNRAGVPDMFGNTRPTACGAETALKAEAGTAYYGVDHMEYYLR